MLLVIICISFISLGLPDGLLGSYVMSYFLSRGEGWSSGYFSVFLLQAVFTAVLFFSLPLCRKNLLRFQVKEAYFEKHYGFVEDGLEL